MNREIDLISAKENIFGLNNAAIYTCNIQGLSGEFPVMWIQVSTQDHKIALNIVLRGVHLFEGPTQWVNANFSVADSNERFVLISKLGWLENVPKELLQEYLQNLPYLIVVDSPSPRYRIRILSISAYSYPPMETPVEFKKKE